MTERTLNNKCYMTNLYIHTYTKAMQVYFGSLSIGFGAKAGLSPVHPLHLIVIEEA